MEFLKNIFGTTETFKSLLGEKIVFIFVANISLIIYQTSRRIDNADKIRYLTKFLLEIEKITSAKMIGNDYLKELLSSVIKQINLIAKKYIYSYVGTLFSIYAILIFFISYILNLSPVNSIIYLKIIFAVGLLSIAFSIISAFFEGLSSFAIIKEEIRLQEKIVEKIKKNLNNKC